MRDGRAHLRVLGDRGNLHEEYRDGRVNTMVSTGCL